MSLKNQDPFGKDQEKIFYKITRTKALAAAGIFSGRKRGPSLMLFYRIIFLGHSRKGIDFLLAPAGIFLGRKRGPPREGS